MTAPHCAEVDFLPAVIIFQVFALGFRKDDLALFRQNQNIRIVIDIAVDTEALTGNISVPPAHIRQGGQFHNQLLFQLVHIAVLCLIQRFRIDVRMRSGMNCVWQTIIRQAYNAFGGEPVGEVLPAMLLQQGLHFILDFLCVTQRRFLHCCKLVLAHVADNALYVGFQFGSVHAIQLVKLTEHNFLALAYPAFRGQTVEVFLEILLLRAGHFEHTGQAVFLVLNIHLNDSIIRCGKINVAVLVFQREALGKLRFIQQHMRTIRKQRIRNSCKELRDDKALNIFPELRLDSECRHLFPHLPRRFLQIGVIARLLDRGIVGLSRAFRFG